jgi:hypothetical protein
MSQQDDIAEDRHGRMLAELAGLSLALARDLQARALAAESADEAAKLATAFGRVARGVRQTLALEMKVCRFREASARQAQELAQQAAQERRAAEEGEALAQARARDARGPVWRRREAIARDVETLIWSEAEAPDWDEPAREAAQGRFDAWMRRTVARRDFLSADLDDLVVDGCRAAGVDPGRIFEGLGPPDRQAGPETQTAPPPPGTAPPQVLADTG